MILNEFVLKWSHEWTQPSSSPKSVWRMDLVQLPEEGADAQPLGGVPLAHRCGRLPFR